MQLILLYYFIFYLFLFLLLYDQGLLIPALLSFSAPCTLVLLSLLSWLLVLVTYWSLGKPTQTLVGQNQVFHEKNLYFLEKISKIEMWNSVCSTFFYATITSFVIRIFFQSQEIDQRYFKKSVWSRRIRRLRIKMRVIRSCWEVIVSVMNVHVK